jgi:hypothetical protein
MRKVVLSLLLAASVAAAADAGQFVAGAFGVSLIRQSYQTVDPLAAVGIPVTLVDFAGERIGFYVVASFALITQASAGGVPIDLDGYDLGLSVDIMIGLGFDLPIGGRFSCILGFGPTLGFLTLMPAFGSAARYYGGASVLGIGAGATLRWLLAPRLYLAATAVGAVQFSTLMSIVESLRVGLLFAPSLGIGFQF